MTNKNTPFESAPRLRYPRGGRTRALSQWVLSTLVRQGARPGDKLPTEHELCRILKVSRSTVRQALKSLDSFGLVDARPRRGSVLKAANTQDLGPLFGAALVLSTRAPRGDQGPDAKAREDRHLADLAEARWLQELAVVPLAAKRRTQDDLDAMKKAEEAFRDAMDKHDLDALRNADADFHRALVSSAHNPVLSGLTELIDGYFRMLQIRTVSRTSGEARKHDARTLQEHAAVRMALSAGDAAKAARILDRHLSRIVHATQEGNSQP